MRPSILYEINISNTKYNLNKIQNNVHFIINTGINLTLKMNEDNKFDTI